MECTHNDHFLNLYGTVADSIVDGPGLRFSVFVQGCSHRCPGCHNPESQPAGPEHGTQRSIESILNEIHQNPLIRNVTLSGGEPFEQPQACAALAKQLKQEGYGVWTYTGYLIEDLLNQQDPHIRALLEATDVLVDGPFVEANKSHEITWRGSTNQRVIDVPATLQANNNQIILWEESFEPPARPASW